MIARFLFAGFVLCLSSSLWSADSPLAEARSLLRKGKWDEARTAFEALRVRGEAMPAVIAGLAEIECSVGDYDKALQITSAARKEKDSPDLQAVEADLLYQRGRWDEASKLVDGVLAKDKNHYLARFTRARILRDKGDLKEASDEMRWFVREYTKASNADKDIKDIDKLLITGQAGTDNARWKSLSDQFRFILNELYADVLKIDPEVWRAEYLAGMMLLEKYNRPEAMDAFDKAIAINPNAADAHVGKGQVALLTYELKDAETYANRALKINPKLPSALCLKADVLLIADDFAAAAKELEKALPVNPRDEEVLGRLAACQFLLNQQERLGESVKQVEAFTSKPVYFFNRLAKVLEDRKLYKPAEEYYKRAIACGEQFPQPRAGLAMLYLRLGRESDAKALLDKAFDADRFNVRVSNSIKVLKHLEKYKTVETKHYELRFDPKTDEILAEFVADYLEDTHTRLAVEFGYEPPGKTLIELFNSHEMFSGRTIALPDLHTIGACTGPVVTMASPRAKGLARPFNWGRVIRHELVHVFNLTQTDFKVPHWLTEGLAVRNEALARPHAWSKELKRAYDANELLNLDTIMLGFVRPRTPDEWMLAYCQSHLYVEFMAKTYGAKTIGQMLAAYREGLDTGAAIQKVCGVPKAEFEKSYKDSLKAVVAAIPLQPVAKAVEEEMTIDELEEARRDKPEDWDLAARLAEQYQKRDRPADARKLIEQVLKNKPGHALALVVKSKLLAASGDAEEAQKLLEEAVKQNPSDAKLLMNLAQAYRANDNTTKAIDLLEKGRKLAPLDGNWLEQLVEIYQQREDLDKLESVLREICDFDADDLANRVRLATLYERTRKFAEAERAAREALEVDVLNADARRILLASLKEQKKDAEFAKIEKRFASLPKPMSKDDD